MITSPTTPFSAQAPGFSGDAGGVVRKLAGLPRGRALLRVGVFWKIFLANVALVAIGAGGGAALALSMHDASVGTMAVTVVGLGAVVILLGILVNAVLVRTALSPLQALEETARRVGQGQTDARVEDSPFSDSGLSRISEVFNRMLDALSANQTRQQELARRVLESEERERQRIAHELYSGTAQTLAGVLVRLRIAERQLVGASDEAINEIREEVVNALEEIRGVARRLRPPELDELGVRVALEAHARSMTEGRRTEFQFKGDIPPLSRETSLALFRIVQEAISNAVLHSGADSVRVTFVTEGGSVTAEVLDDGCGFDLATALGQTGQSLGLFGMHERAGYVQGELSLESGPGRGTRVRVVLPVTPPQEPRPVDGTVDRLVDGLVEDEELATASSVGPRADAPPF